jgi:uncharacterized protein (TIGR02246 family)
MNKLETVKAYWAAEKAKDLERILSHFTDTAEFVAPGVHHKGRGNIQKFYRGIINNYKGLTVHVDNAIEAGDQIAVQYTCDLELHSGGTKQVTGCNVFTFEGNRFSHLRCYFNPADF